MGHVAQAGGIGAVFFLDEMQGLDKVALEAVCMAMNRVGQRSLPVALVGAGLPPLPRLLRAAKPYAERMFAYRELDRLSDAEARLALIAPAAQLKVEYEPKAVGYKDISSTSLLRENLMRKDLIYSPRRGLVAFTVPLFAGYVQEHHPLASFDE